MALIFNVHPQVACEEAAGRYFLVAYGKAKEELPYLREINDTGAFYWRLAARGLNLNVMVTEASKIYDAPLNDLETGIRHFFYDLAAKGYVSIYEDLIHH